MNQIVLLGDFSHLVVNAGGNDALEHARTDTEPPPILKAPGCGYQNTVTGYCLITKSSLTSETRSTQA